MKSSLRLPLFLAGSERRYIGQAAVSDVAQAAEEAGFDSVYLTDHPAPNEAFLANGGHQEFDPLITLAYVAGVTRRLRLLTSLIVLPYRNPLLTAKSLATLDVVSGGRLMVGAGTGYVADEFEAMGVDISQRNELTDEALDVMELAWSGDPVNYEGHHFSARGVVVLPTPVQRPRPPIWIGGNSRRAIRRAVQYGDFWMPFPYPLKCENPVESISPGLAYARSHAAQVGRRTELGVAYVPQADARVAGLRPAEFLAASRALAKAGVTYALVHLPMPSVSELIDAIAEFASDVAPELDSIK
jgi:probable F420-dependent oxidoreductase